LDVHAGGDAAVNLQITAPLDEAPIAAGEDAIARVLGDARLRDGGELLDALDARRVELGLANATVENLAGLPVGYLTKVAGPARSKSPTLATLDRVMTVLGLSIVLVRDPEKIDRVQSNWRRRDEAHVRQRLSRTTLKRALPIIVDDLLRRAARRKWSGCDARTFLRAQVRDA
jgi:hypothetical protein